MVVAVGDRGRADELYQVQEHCEDIHEVDVMCPQVDPTGHHSALKISISIYTIRPY